MTPVAAGGNLSLLSPACPAGFTVTGGGTAPDSFLVFAVTGFALGNAWQCAVRNSDGVAHNVQCTAVCAQTPGR